MQESGLEELFNQKCGDLQILDANKCDDTTVPDQKKLEKFLSSVLAGDELTARIREAFDAYNEVVFSDALLTALQNIAVKKKDDSPEHKYYIGLASLSGVDVEVDHKRAVSLITSAADAGLIKAIEKLIQMYRNGEGVARDRHKAIQ